MGSQRLKSHAWGLHVSARCPLCRCYGSELGVFVRCLALGTGVVIGVSMTPFSALDTLFPLLGCIVESHYEGFFLVLSLFVLFDCPLLEACSLLAEG